MKVELGRTYKHMLFNTGGIATGRTEFLTGCAQVQIKYVKDGKLEADWFDEPMLVPNFQDDDLTPEQRSGLATAVAEDPGGPRATPARRSAGSRPTPRR